MNVKLLNNLSVSLHTLNHPSVYSEQRPAPRGRRRTWLSQPICLVSVSFLAWSRRVFHLKEVHTSESFRAFCSFKITIPVSEPMHSELVLSFGRVISGGRCGAKEGSSWSLRSRRNTPDPLVQMHF